MKSITLMGCFALCVSTLAAQADYILRVVHFPNLAQSSEPFNFAELTQNTSMTRIFYPELIISPGKETSIQDGRFIELPAKFNDAGTAIERKPFFQGQIIHALLEETPSANNYKITLTISSNNAAGFDTVTANNGSKYQRPLKQQLIIESTQFLQEGRWLPTGIPTGPNNGLYAVQIIKR